MANVEKISVSLPRDMIDDIRGAVESGAYATTSEVLRDAVRGWQERRAEPLARITPKSISDLKRMVQEGIDSARRGKVKPAEEVFARLEKKYAAMERSRRRASARKSRT